jgi:poly(beta-D-mannuronate) lyase
VLVEGSASGHRLPYDADRIRAAQTTSPAHAAACPALVTPPRALQHGTRFRAGDKSASVVDPDRQVTAEAAVEPVRAFNRIVSNISNRALREPQHTDAYRQCVLQHLDHWASGGAFTGANSSQGEFEKKWSSITAALGYLDARAEATPAQSRRIEAWLQRLGSDVLLHYNVPIPKDVFSSRTNNHAYWAALSTVVTGMATGQRTLFEWGMARFHSALDDIDNRGLLRHELRRASLALSYHRFALKPLLLLRLIAASNDVEVSLARDEALQRLIARVEAGQRDPSGFAILSGHVQQFTPASAKKDWAWAEMAIALYGRQDLEARIRANRPYTDPWLGGDLTLRYGLRDVRPAAPPKRRSSTSDSPGPN